MTRADADDTPTPSGDVAAGRPASDLDTDATICPRCNESSDLAKVKGCIKCLKCGFKFDCNGW
jgi:ribosomal protein S27AE